MARNRTTSPLIAGALATAAVSVAAAGPPEIYHWVDADGRAHFSDTRPPDEVPAETITLELEPSAESYDPVSDPYSILNQSKRTHERWLATEAVRRDRAERQSGTARDPLSASESRDLVRSDFYGYGYGWAPGYGIPARPSPPNSAAARQQQRALEELDLTGPRPASINSGAHEARVERSQALPLVPVASPRTAP